MGTPRRLLNLLAQFTVERPAWTAEELADALGMSVSSTYRYIGALADTGFLATEATGLYILGPAFIEYDRTIRNTDPLLKSAVPAMKRLIRKSPQNMTLVLCRLYGDSVICVHQETGRVTPSPISYERGRPMPLLRGASSKIILAYLPYRSLRRIYKHQHEAIAQANLGGDWATFIETLAQIRQAGVSITHAEVDEGRTGIAIPLLSEDRRVLGSLSFVADMSATDTTPTELAAMLTGAAAQFMVRGDKMLSEQTDKS